MEGIKGLVAQVAGTDEAATGKIAYTFNALAKSADFSGSNEQAVAESEAKDQAGGEAQKTPLPSRLRSEFHFNIQVHLPGNASEETYRNIFNALRKTFE